MIVPRRREAKRKELGELTDRSIKMMVPVMAGVLCKHAIFCCASTQGDSYKTKQKYRKLNNEKITLSEESDVLTMKYRRDIVRTINKETVQVVSIGKECEGDARKKDRIV